MALRMRAPILPAPHRCPMPLAQSKAVPQQPSLRQAKRSEGRRSICAMLLWRSCPFPLCRYTCDPYQDVVTKSGRVVHCRTAGRGHFFRDKYLTGLSSDRWIGGRCLVRCSPALTIGAALAKESDDEQQAKHEKHDAASFRCDRRAGFDRRIGGMCRLSGRPGLLRPCALLLARPR